MPNIFLLAIELTAVCCDLCMNKIPNALTVGGMILGAACQWSANGPPGLREFAFGAILPVIVLGALHYFRMLGAGDIKLLMAAGGFLGSEKSLECIFLSFLCAAAISAAVLIKHRILRQRLNYFCEYIHDYKRNGKWVPYIKHAENPAYLHFSIPICFGTLLLFI